ncbi:MAG: hypothetical protein ACJ8AT_17945 [Hyalangium sp.]|uniref:hypothetical protein n=1 Tax=Hyalangium sp. TaxID=2028555 RepID=UPI0038999D30
MASHSKSPPRSRGKRGSSEAELSARQRELYALPLEEFTRARDALAKELAAKGRAQDAQAIKKLKRPVVAAWVVNQLAHQHPDHLEELLAAARSLEKAQRRAMSGLASEPLKEANRAFQRALDTLMKDVTTSLAATGRPAMGDLIRQVDETLRTAALGSEEDRSTLTQGMLTRPLHSSGFGPFSGLELVGAATDRAPRRPEKPPPSPRPAKPAERPAPSAPPTGGKVLHGPWKPQPAPPKRTAPPPAPRRPSRAETQAQARQQREVELRQLRREARQQAEQANQAERNARQSVVRTNAVLRTAEAKTRHARGALEAAETKAQKAREALEAAEEQARRAREALEAAQEAEQAQAEEASRAEEEARAAEQALTQARRHLQQTESRLSR